MTHSLTLREAVQSDLGALDRLFTRSYSRLLAQDYPPSVLALAVPIMGRAKMDLLKSGRFFLIEDDRRALAAGGWSLGSPGRGIETPGLGHIRQVATDPGMTRQGLGSGLLQHILWHMAKTGVTEATCQSSLTAEKFYASHGFVAQGLGKVLLAGTLPFKTVTMNRML